MSASGPPRSISMRSFGEQRLRFPGQPLLTVRVGGSNERPEQRMRLKRLRLELRVELATEIPRMIRDLTDLDIRAVHALPGKLQPVAG